MDLNPFDPTAAAPIDGDRPADAVLDAAVLDPAATRTRRHVLIADSRFSRDAVAQIRLDVVSLWDLTMGRRSSMRRFPLTRAGPSRP